MTRAAWVALAVGGLLLAALVVVLPQVRDDAGGGQAPADGAELADAREQAGLPPCPSGSGEPVKKLAGVTATCLADGRKVDVGQMLAGKVTLINVWATWCPPCRDELPVLQEYASSPGAVQVLTVQVDSPPADGLRMLADLGVRLPTVHDGDERYGPLRRALSAPNVLPASYVVDRDGTVRLVSNPRVFATVDQVRSAVTRHRKGAE
ncbi:MULTISPECIES: TlpA disulfide reductase family protein [Thermocrispum]|uniref:TlpA disulfide reductase family protein n=1 Tax=Thermocrispum agreste TaxID=37925 RepID=A0A2W4JJ20_9PSEU|nr:MULTISPECIES: TlpA disulfide reductase family protein [Thermocrispum]PZM99060.1 MAG: TlpA family protein disulfide reductase [Thermocrispum agreste]